MYSMGRGARCKYVRRKAGEGVCMCGRGKVTSRSRWELKGDLVGESQGMQAHTDIALYRKSTFSTNPLELVAHISIGSLTQFRILSCEHASNITQKA